MKGWIETKESSNVQRFKYDEKKKKLTIWFKSGSKYLYHDVEKKIYDGLMVAESIGKYIHANIKDQYEYEQL